MIPITRSASSISAKTALVFLLAMVVGIFGAGVSKAAIRPAFIESSVATVITYADRATAAPDDFGAILEGSKAGSCLPHEYSELLHTVGYGICCTLDYYASLIGSPSPATAVEAASEAEPVEALPAPDPEPELNEFEDVASAADPIEESSEAEPEPKQNEFVLEVSYHGASQAAIDEGGIVEYADDYYAAHNYAAGSVFFDFEPGTIVHIDGRTVVIIGCGYFHCPDDMIEDIKDIYGWDKAYFQTCMPEGGGAIVVYYGCDA